MIVTIHTILEILDEMAPFSLAEEWDNAGLQVGSPSGEVHSILVALDPTSQAIGYASELGAQLLLTHHPLIFKPLSRIDIDNYPGDVVREALLKKIAIVAIHTNLDAARGGINDILSDLIGLTEVEVLQKKDLLIEGEAGLGRIGNLHKTLNLREMTERIKDVLGVKRLKVMGAEKRKIKKIAVVGGAGGEMASLASQRGADLLVTGDVKHHEALAAKTFGLALIDGGHFQTEKVALNIFADHFRERLITLGHHVSIEKFKDEIEPMKYG